MQGKMLYVKGKGYSRIQSDNPFSEEPQPKAFYHPTQEKTLTPQQKQVALSPRKADDARRRQETEKERWEEEKKFLDGCHEIRPLEGVQRHRPKSPDSDNFNESWAPSERPSSPSLTEEERSLPYAAVRKHVQPTFTSRPLAHADPTLTSLYQGHADFTVTSRPYGNMDPTLTSRPQGPTDLTLNSFSWGGAGLPSSDRAEERSRKMEESGLKKGEDGKTGSVLQRYIERFRHGTPTSREERQRHDKGDKREDFWWLKSGSGLPLPNSTSTPKEQEGRSLRLTSQGQGTLTAENLQRQQREHEDLDSATRELQARADRMLHSASSAVSSGPVVSTEGLGSVGSTGSDVTGSSFSEAAVRPPIIPYGEASAAWLKGGKGRSAGADGQEDILFKWRLQRKLEAARSAPYPATHADYLSCQKQPGKTQAEREVEQRLAAFRQNLLGRGSMVNTHLQQARVAENMKRVQATMDTAVQTSPLRPSPPPSSSSPSFLPSSLSHPHPHPQTCSEETQTSERETSRDNTQPTTHGGKCQHTPLKDPVTFSESAVQTGNNNNNVGNFGDVEHTEMLGKAGSEYETEGGRGGGKRGGGGERKGAERREEKGKRGEETEREKSGGGKVKYRQFLQAERPHDGGDGNGSGVTSPASSVDHHHHHPHPHHLTQGESSSSTSSSSPLPLSSTEKPVKEKKKNDDRVTNDADVMTGDVTNAAGDAGKKDAVPSPRNRVGLPPLSGERSQGPARPHRDSEGPLLSSGSTPRKIRISDGGDYIETETEEKEDTTRQRETDTDRDRERERDSNSRSLHRDRLPKGQREQEQQHHHHHYRPQQQQQQHHHHQQQQQQQHHHQQQQQQQQQQYHQQHQQQHQQQQHRDPTGDRRSGVDRSRVMPPPQLSSSPARTSLSSVIGQVVHDRLLDISVLSSVEESSTSLHFSGLSPPVHHHHPSPPDHDESDPESDGEFEFDPLLVVLREQRDRHERQLRCLDAILAERET